VSRPPDVCPVLDDGGCRDCPRTRLHIIAEPGGRARERGPSCVCSCRGGSPLGYPGGTCWKPNPQSSMIVPRACEPYREADKDPVGLDGRLCLSMKVRIMPPGRTCRSPGIRGQSRTNQVFDRWIGIGGYDAYREGSRQPLLHTCVLLYGSRKVVGDGPLSGCGRFSWAYCVEVAVQPSVQTAASKHRRSGRKDRRSGQDDQDSSHSSGT
jgi:hypothetical protein